MKTKIGTRNGSALTTVMLVVAVLSLVAASVGSFALYQPHAVHRARCYIKAAAIAEAGANEAYSMLVTNFALRFDANAFPAKSFGNGTYDADVTPVGSNLAAIVSLGTYQMAKVRVRLDVKNFGGSLPGTPGSGGGNSPWDYAIFCNGDLGLSGASTVHGRIHTNGDFTQSGTSEWGDESGRADITIHGTLDLNGNLSLNGSLAATDKTKTSKDPIGGSLALGNVDKIDFPEIYLDDFRKTAEDFGQVKSVTSLTINGDVPGGVVWLSQMYDSKGRPVDVTVNINNSARVTIISEGGVIINGVGGTTLSGPNKGPAVISRDGTVTIDGAHTTEGLVYAKGAVVMNGRGFIEGGVVAGSNVDFNGRSDIGIGYAPYDPPTPPTPGSNRDIIGVTAWQE